MELDRTNPYIAMILRIQEASAANTKSNTTTRINPLEEADLGGVDCDICNNTGYVVRRDENGVDWSRECVCMKARRSKRSLRNSGLADMVTRYTFLNYKTPNRECEKIKAKAIRFCDEPEGWFYISGQPGSGKTHICTAICNEFIKQGRSLKYMLWRDESVLLRALMTDQEAYADKMYKLKTIPVLYIDDFLKCKGEPTPAELNLAFELINGRYNNEKLRTIISTERSIENVLDFDEALGSRIYEKSKGYCLSAPHENWRMRQ